MVDISARLQEIRELVDNGDYFVINRARQYGKTTVLKNLKKTLSDEYFVFSISFEGLTYDVFDNENTFCQRVFKLLYTAMLYGNKGEIPEQLKTECYEIIQGTLPKPDLWTLSNFISKMCVELKKPAVLMIDEVDQASNQQIFLAFLGMLRDQYINRNERPAFQSVILACVYDIKNLKPKIRSSQDHQFNSPWNIAAKFSVDMSFSAKDIEGMLAEYDKDHHANMDIVENARLIYEYTSGYPFLVSAICKNIAEELANDWTQNGVMQAIHMLLKQQNTLFDDMIKHLVEYPELSTILQNILFEGQDYPFNAYAKTVNIGLMFGFVKDINGQVTIANKIFETHLYNYFLAEEISMSSTERTRLPDRNQFVHDGTLDMMLVMKKFVEYYSDIYQEADDTFLEKHGRKIFLLYLKPIINGTGNFYVESQTRDLTRTDVIIDYLGKQYIVELKIWRGDAYREKGEKQLCEYLELYRQRTGYMLIFNFNKHKEVGMKEVFLDGKTVYEFMV